MEIEKIIYQTLRSVEKVDDKLSIATLFLFCFQYDQIFFADLIYGDNPTTLIELLHKDLEPYEVDFSVNLSNPNVKMGLRSTIERVKEKYDKDGYYKALHEGHEFALTIYEICNTEISKIHTLKRAKQQLKQLAFNF